MKLILFSNLIKLNPYFACRLYEYLMTMGKFSSKSICHWKAGKICQDANFKDGFLIFCTANNPTFSIFSIYAHSRLNIFSIFSKYAKRMKNMQKEVFFFNHTWLLYRDCIWKNEMAGYTLTYEEQILYIATIAKRKQTQALIMQFFLSKWSKPVPH
jgi:hypothetical protein